MPPPQPCEARGAGLLAGADGAAPPTEANTDSRRRAPTWPLGQSTGSEDSLMGLRTSNDVSHSGQRYS